MKITKYILVVIGFFIVISINGVARSQCDCLGYYEEDDSNKRIQHTHHDTAGLCTGYAFSKANSFITGPSHSERKLIIIYEWYAQNYWETWGFYNKFTNKNSAVVGDIAIWWYENGEDKYILHAGVITSTIPIKLSWVRNMDGLYQSNQANWFENREADFYLHQTQWTYGYSTEAKTSIDGGNGGEIIVDDVTKSILPYVNINWDEDEEHELKVKRRQIHESTLYGYLNWSQTGVGIVATNPDSSWDITVNGFHEYTANFDEVFDVLSKTILPVLVIKDK